MEEWGGCWNWGKGRNEGGRDGEGGVGERGSESSEGLPCNKLNSFFFHFSAPVLVMRAGASDETGFG
jgi:hypothetical protein